VVFGPVRQRHPDRPAALGDHVVDRRLEHDLRAERARGACQHLGEARRCPLVEGPCAEFGIVLADRVVEQHEPEPCDRGPTLVPMMLDEAR
jgi:hypothetical protein